ncbi:hypothetical protein Leryth_027387 [Lithospermum erythrorhizon]|nr:hypothetical protein Leryth_027387 [Lithospermum erythrorhizon]
MNRFIKCPPLTSVDLQELWSPDIINPREPHSPKTNNSTKEKTTSVIEGKAIAKDIKSQIADEINGMKSKRSDSDTFVDLKLKACDRVGIASFKAELPEDCTEDELLGVISDFNLNPSVHGVIVQLPLPKHLSEEKVMSAVSAEKDVDGFHPLHIGNLAIRGRDPLFIPCAARCCIELLLRYDVQIMGKKAVVIGRSKIVGLPISLLLQRYNATVTVIHAFTKNPERLTREADIVVADAGIPNLVRGHWLKEGAFVIDMGTNSIKDANCPHGYHLVGDVCFKEAITKVSAITPVPGGVGPITISMLLTNTLDSAKRMYKFS